MRLDHLSSYRHCERLALLYNNLSIRRLVYDDDGPKYIIVTGYAPDVACAQPVRKPASKKTDLAMELDEWDALGEVVLEQGGPSRTTANGGPSSNHINANARPFDWLTPASSSGAIASSSALPPQRSDATPLVQDDTDVGDQNENAAADSFFEGVDAIPLETLVDANIFRIFDGLSEADRRNVEDLDSTLPGAEGGEEDPPPLSAEQADEAIWLKMRRVYNSM